MGKRKYIKSIISTSLDIPSETILNVPSIKIIGNSEINIENHKGIIEYSKEILRINSIIGIIKITGKDLHIKEINHEETFLTGTIYLIEFIS